MRETEGAETGHQGRAQTLERAAGVTIINCIVMIMACVVFIFLNNFYNGMFKYMQN